MTGSGKEACSVYLSAPAPSRLVVRLSSSSPAVKVPGAVTVSPGATSTGFAAIVSAVTSAQAVTLTASAGGVSKYFLLQLSGATPTLTINTSRVAFGNVAVNAPAMQSLALTSTGNAPVTISAASLTGAGFTISGATFPATLNPNQTITLSVLFKPAATGAATGQLTLISNSSTSPIVVIGLSGTGAPAASSVVSAVSCGKGSMTGSGTRACSVYLSAEPVTPLVVWLSSDNAAVAVPSAVTVAVGATHTGFAAAVSPVSSALVVTLTASAGGVSQNLALQLNASIPTLSINPGSLTFGNVTVNAPVEQFVTLSSTGTAPVTISTASVVGKGFTISGASLPVTLNPGQILALGVQFNPASIGVASGQLAISSNSSNGPTALIALSGTGTTAGAPALSSVSCLSGSFTGSGTIACSVYLTAAATFPLTFGLSSNNSAFKIPATVNVVAGSTHTGFMATVSSVSSAQTVKLTASAGSISKCFPLLLNAANSTYIYVDGLKGSNSRAGTILLPLKTIQAAISLANTKNVKSIGTTIIVNPGVYREFVNISRISKQTSAPITIEAAAAGMAIIAGSDILSGWTSESGSPSIYSSPWPHKFGTCPIPSGWPTDFAPIALRTEMIFVGGVPLTQVISNSDLKPGTFLVDEPRSLIHVWPPAGIDMQTASVEAAVRPRTLSVSGRSNVTLAGLVFRHARSCLNQTGMSVSDSQNLLIDSVQAVWNNWGGLGVFSSKNVTVQNSIASYNGGVGFLGNKDQNALFDFNESDYNNWRGAQAAFYEWAMGGTKLFAMRGTTVLNHFSYNNQGEGLWFDTDNKNIVIDNATSSGNVTAALQIERNEGPVLVQNSHFCSSGTGINVLTSQDLTIKDNVLYNNGGTNKYQAEIYLAGQLNGIQIPDWQTGQTYDLFTTRMVLSGNAFTNASAGQLIFGTYLGGGDWSGFASTLKADNNHWYDPNTTKSFKIPGGKLADLAGWQNAVGTDTTSDWSAPATSGATACAAPTPQFTDFNVNTDDRSYAMISGKAAVTVRVNSFGFGNVTLSVTGLPSGVTASFSKPTLVSGVSTLMLSSNASAATQKLPITLWAVGSGRNHSVTFNVHVSK